MNSPNRETIERKLVKMGVPPDKAKLAALEAVPEPDRDTLRAERRAAKRIRVETERRIFRLWCHEQGLPNPTPELAFARESHNKGWRFDWAWADPDTRDGVALEIEGGVYSNGRHVRPTGYLGDVAKYNAAAELGWRLYRTTPDRLYTEETADALRRLLCVRKPS